MPWKITNPMDQKIQFIADWQRAHYSLTDLSKKYGISRKTAYKWCSRYETVGIDGLKDQSRVPKHSPNKTNDAVIALLIKEKLKNRNRGPVKIYHQLKRRYPGLPLPAPSTIAHWLKKNGLVQRRKKRNRVPPYAEPFIRAQAPNDVWSADYKGQFYTRNRQVCYPLTISDNYSRYLLKCVGLPGPRYRQTRSVFEDVFREYGLPNAIRVDNGTPFAGRCVGGLSRLSIWWIRLGIMPERIERGAPEQNGRHERMHRTLKLEAIHSTTVNIKEQQKLFDVFLYDYNNNRPHEALNHEPPAEHYRCSSRQYVERLPAVEYDLDYTVRSVRYNGYFRFNGQFYYLTDLLYKERVGLKEFADGQWTIYYNFYPIGILDLHVNKVLKFSGIEQKM